MLLGMGPLFCSEWGRKKSRNGSAIWSGMNSKKYRGCRSFFLGLAPPGGQAKSEDVHLSRAEWSFLRFRLSGVGQLFPGLSTPNVQECVRKKFGNVTEKVQEWCRKMYRNGAARWSGMWQQNDQEWAPVQARIGSSQWLGLLVEEAAGCPCSIRCAAALALGLLRCRLWGGLPASPPCHYQGARRPSRHSLHDGNLAGRIAGRNVALSGSRG